MKELQKELRGIAEQIHILTQYVEKINLQLAGVSLGPLASKPKASKALRTKRNKKRDKTIKKTASISVTKRVAAKRGKLTILDVVYNAIRRTRKGVSIAKLTAKTGYEGRQLSNALYKLTTKGMVTAISRGRYIQTPSQKS